MFGGCERGEGRDAGDDLHGESQPVAQGDLFADGAPQCWVAGVDACHGQTVCCGPFVQRHDSFHGQLRGVDDLGARSCVLEDARVDQARGPDDDVGAADGLRTAKGDEVRSSRTRSDE